MTVNGDKTNILSAEVTQERGALSQDVFACETAGVVPSYVRFRTQQVRMGVKNRHLELGPMLST